MAPSHSRFVIWGYGSPWSLREGSPRGGFEGDDVAMDPCCLLDGHCDRFKVMVCVLRVCVLRVCIDCFVGISFRGIALHFIVFLCLDFRAPRLA